MNEALILEKLDSLAGEIQALKAEVRALQEIRPDRAPAPQEARQSAPSPSAGFQGKDQEKDLDRLVANLAFFAEDINAMLVRAKAGNELLDDLGPIVHQVYPQVIRFFAELEEQLSQEDLIGLCRNLLAAVPALREGLSLFKSSMELKEELLPIARLLYPKVITLFQELQLTIERSDGLITVAAAAARRATTATLTSAQTQEIVRIIEEFDVRSSQPLSPLGAIRQLMQPEVQHALGAIFALLRSAGACLAAIEKK
ncbi:MAG: DUF1641 domain-containing protein [Desulfopila sp.]